MMDEPTAKNTDRTIWQEREGDYYADSILVTESGGIGINCGGNVIVRPLREWHRLASPPPMTDALIERLEAHCVGHPHAKIPWPHRLLHEAAQALKAKDAEIERMRDSFQSRVQPWMLSCFTPEIAADKLERNDRFIEEALELVQASGYPKERALALVDYVYGRDQGEINQEVGGVMVTLAAHCLAHGVDMHKAGETELARILQPEIMEKIRAKQAAKPTGSALPVALKDRDG